MTSSPSLIEFDNVSLVRGNTRILDRICLSIPQAQNVAIVGPNGSGKSTLLKLLMKFFYPSVVDGASGAVRVLGNSDWNVWELRKHLGFISSEIDQHFCQGRSARLTAFQAVLTGFFASELEPNPNCYSDDMKSEADRLLRWFRMESLRDQPVGHMSTGERRRVLLARALVFRPKALVLDEPTSGLDLLARARLLDEVQRLSRTGTQVVLVTHYLEEILPGMERVVLLKRGQIFFDGLLSDGLTEPRISDLYDAPIKIARDRNGFLVASLGRDSAP
jgi:iron complex transport system ATP-binding protein